MKDDPDQIQVEIAGDLPEEEGLMGGVPMTKEALADMLELIAERVRSGDSYEGNISWEPPEDDVRRKAGDIDVRGMFRTRSSVHVIDLEDET